MNGSGEIEEEDCRDQEQEEQELEQRLVSALREVIEFAVKEGLPDAVGMAYAEAVAGVARGDSGWPECPAHTVQQVDLLMRAISATLDLAVTLGLPEAIGKAYWAAVVGVGVGLGGDDEEEGGGE